MTTATRWVSAGFVVVVLVAGCRSAAVAPTRTSPATTAPSSVPTTAAPGAPSRSTAAVSPLHDAPLPPPVSIRPSPDGVTLADPTFTALAGARAEFGMLGGTVYQIEIPDQWNGRLVMFMHGYGELAPQASVSPPDVRHYLITHGYAWAASSFSSTLIIPGRAADETAALWDYFVARHGRPTWSYVTGFSMGGWATHIAAERYGNRYDGALAMCGAAGLPEGARISAEFFVAAAFVAGVTQDEFDATKDTNALIDQRILPTLADPSRHALFEQIMIDLTGGPRAFAQQGFHAEEATNWQRARLGLAARAFPPRDGPYVLGPAAGVSSAVFDRDAIRLPTSDFGRTLWTGTELNGNLQMPMLTLHTTGDGQVPINQAQILLRRVTAAGSRDRLVQRVVQDPGHCGFSPGEQEAAFESLVGWVEHGSKPAGTNLAVTDLSHLDHTFELQTRDRTPGSAPDLEFDDGAVISGHAILDGVPLTAQFMGAVVLDDGLVTPCQANLPTVDAGHYEIPVYAQSAAAGCGRPGATIVLWTSAANQIIYATTTIPWPAQAGAQADINFSTTQPRGAAPQTTEFEGDVYDHDGQRVPSGTLVEAYIGQTRCGIASTRSGVFTGYIMSIVGPDSKPGCRAGDPITFLVDGKPTIDTHTRSTDHIDPLDLTIA